MQYNNSCYSPCFILIHYSLSVLTVNKLQNSYHMQILCITKSLKLLYTICIFCALKYIMAEIVKIFTIFYQTCPWLNDKSFGLVIILSQKKNRQPLGYLLIFLDF